MCMKAYSITKMPTNVSSTLRLVVLWLEHPNNLNNSWQTLRVTKFLLINHMNDVYEWMTKMLNISQKLCKGLLTPTVWKKWWPAIQSCIFRRESRWRENKQIWQYDKTRSSVTVPISQYTVWKQHSPSTIFIQDLETHTAFISCVNSRGHIIFDSIM